MSGSDPAIQSPCTGVCVIHRRKHLCVGCYRSLDEIASWGGLSPKARQDVMDDLPARKARMTRKRRD